MTKKPTILAQVTISTVEDQHITRHIIICGIRSGINTFIRPLRAKSIGTMAPIVILVTDPPKPELWESIARFPYIYVVQGSALKPHDLERAGIEHALSVVILANFSGIENLEEGMMDADTIFIYKTLKQQKTQAKIIVELTSIGTISFLSGGNNFKKSAKNLKASHFLSDMFASGEVYLPNMLDTLVCQAYYNPYISDIFNQMIMGDALLNRQTKREFRELNLQQCNLFLVGIPSEFAELTYGELFEIYCKEQKIVPIGLYRAPVKVPSHTRKASHQRQHRQFVFLNPPPECMINPGDMVYVLSPREPEMISRDTVIDDVAEKARAKGYKAKDKAEHEIIEILLNIHSQLVDATSQAQDLVATFEPSNITSDIVEKTRVVLHEELHNVYRPN